MGGAARECDGFVAVDERAAVHHDAAASHSGELLRPKPMPEGIVCRIGGTSVEVHAFEFPAFLLANSVGELLHVIIWVRITEGLASGVVEILAVNENAGTLLDGFCKHVGGLEKDNPVRGPEACRTGEK